MQVCYSLGNVTLDLENYLLSLQRFGSMDMLVQLQVWLVGSSDEKEKESFMYSEVNLPGNGEEVCPHKQYFIAGSSADCGVLHSLHSGSSPLSPYPSRQYPRQDVRKCISPVVHTTGSQTIRRYEEFSLAPLLVNQNPPGPLPACH